MVGHGRPGNSANLLVITERDMFYVSHGKSGFSPIAEMKFKLFYKATVLLSALWLEGD